MFVSTSRLTPLTPPHAAHSGGFLFMPKTASANTAEATLLFSDEQEWSSESALESGVSFSDEVSPFSLNALTSTFALADARQEIRTQTVADTIRVRDALRHAGSSNVETTIGFTDVAVGDSAQVVTDNLAFTDQREVFTVSTRTLEDTIRFRDAVTRVSTQIVASSLTFTDAQAQATGQTFESTLVLSDQIDDGSAHIDDLVSRFTLSDAHEIQRVGQHDVVEHITFTDTHFHKDPSATAWVMNTETAAPYWYSNWQFSDMIQVGDKVLAVGPEGLCVIGANTDAGETIEAAVQYGFTDFGTEQKKRVPEFVFGYTAETPMGVMVETYGQGYPPYEYSLSAQRLSEQPNNGRLTPGKGLNARYWRIEIHNTDGGAFSVNSITASLAVSSRRL